MEIGWFTFILATVILILLYWSLKKNINYWAERGVPHAKSLPLFGSTIDVILLRKTMAEVNNEIYNKFKKEKYCGLHMFTVPMLMIRDIELINHILIKDFSHFTDRQFAYDEELEVFNASLVSMSGERWKVLRHKLTPTFSSGKMKAMFNKMIESGENTIKYIGLKGDIDYDVRDLLFRWIVAFIANASFGINIDAFNDQTIEENEFYKISKRLFKPNFKTQISMLIGMGAPAIKKLFKLKIADKDVNDFFLKLTNDLIEYRKKTNEERFDFLQLMLDERQKELDILSAKNNEIETDKTHEGLELAEDLETDDLELTEHLKNMKFDKNYKVFSDNVIAAQILTFVSGGTETTAAALSFALYELAVNKEIQKRAQEDVDNVIDSYGLNYASLKKLTYIEQILNEVLRLRPPGFFLVRLCKKDFKLPGTDLTIEKDVMVNVPVAAIHSDPDYYPDPHIFNPDRFENMDSIPKGTFFPFGGGPRICIAMRLAMIQMKVFLAMILNKYNIILSDKTKVPLKMDKKSMTQYVEGGMHLRFQPRSL